MAELSLFVTPAEFVQIVQGLATQRGLAAYLSGAAGYYKPLDVDEFYDLLQLPWQRVQFYLAPHPSGAAGPIGQEAKPRELGWIRVEPGQVSETEVGRVLTMSNLITEDREGLPFRPARWLRDLKQEPGQSGMGLRLRFGVTGTNMVFGGESAYPRIGYSEAAEILRDAGTRWKQFLDGNAEFRPPG